MDCSTLSNKIISNERLTEQDGLFMLKNCDMLQLGSLADWMKKKHNPEGYVTFVADTNPNYTNVCDTECLFCAFWRPADANVQGGHNPDIELDYYLDLIKKWKQEIPDLHLHAFSAPEISAIAKYTGIETKDVLQQFWDAGLRTIPGGGAEVLSNRTRKKISPLKIDADRWMKVTREAHEIGFKTTATMMFGHFEEDEDIIEHLERIRQLQDEFGNFLAFIPWTFKPKNTFLERKLPNEIGGERYLRVLALCRIYLDNFKHVQGSWFTQGKKMGSITMNYGASDMGGTLYDENVLGCAENKLRATIDELVHMIRSAGFKPAQRDTFYNIIKEF
jgi:cyclic dehypoxanthinyl futalosine synthase